MTLVTTVFSSMKILVLSHVHKDITVMLITTSVPHVQLLVIPVPTILNVPLVQMEPIYTKLNVSPHVQPDIGLMMPPTPVKFVTKLV